MTSSVTLADYLFLRLRQLGVGSIYGVPGDYNLELLDYIDPAGLQWIGSCNELNAGYAADAHARITGLSALITTFGVGELSAINAVAGSYAEKVPLVHIVGTPSRQQQHTRTQLHHTLNNGDFRVFAQMHSHVTAAQISLIDPRTAPAHINAALLQCLIQSRPVYIEIPTDMVHAEVCAPGLDDKITVSPSIQSEDTTAMVAATINRMYSAKRPMILVDGEIRSSRIIKEVDSLVRQTSWPTWTTPFGKGLADETLDNVHGIYSGKYSNQVARTYVESCDLVLFLGPHLSSHNTYRFSAVPRPEITVEVSMNAVVAPPLTASDLPAKEFMTMLLERLDTSKLKRTESPFKSTSSRHDSLVEPIDPSASALVTHRYFWKRMSQYLLPGDIVLSETGTSGYGSRELVLPEHSRYFGPATWLSIGYMLPAAFGASIARRELMAQGKWAGPDHDRTIVFIGDGSIQMTIQSISEILRHRLNVTIFVINNAGYTVERFIHGKDMAYNDIAPWRYTVAPQLFGAEDQGEYKSHCYQVSTLGDLEATLEKTELISGKGLRIVEVFMGVMDAPQNMIDVMQDRKIKPRVVTKPQYDGAAVVVDG